MLGSTSKVVRYRFQNVRGEVCDPEESNYVVNFPSPAVDDLGLEKGADDEVYLELREDDNLDYIWGRKTEDNERGSTTEGYLDFRGDGSLAIPNWADDFLPHPLYQVAFELNEPENHFRLYSPEDYCQYRLPELRKQGVEIQQSEPVVGPLIITSGFANATDGESVDDLTPWSVSSQRFRLIMYDAYHPVFKQASSFFSGENFRPRPIQWTDLGETDDLPRYLIEGLRIEWKRSPTANRSYQIFKYSEEPIDELDLILPENGFYTIYSKTGHGEQSAWLRYDDPPPGRMYYVGEGWGGTCLEIPEDKDYFIAYIPCETDT